MAKFYGNIGFARTYEEERCLNGEMVKTGIWKEEICERKYQGDITKNYIRRQEASDKLNDDININNSISILADPYAFEHFAHMKYVEVWGVKWKINGVEAQYPRLLISFGGVYNSDCART